MIKLLLINLVYLLDYTGGRTFYLLGYLQGQSRKLLHTIICAGLVSTQSNCLLELLHLREEIRRLKSANRLMRQELNRVQTKRLCLCRKLQVIYFKLRFAVSLRKINRYLPISKTTVLTYLNQLQFGLSNLASRTRGYHSSSSRTPLSITTVIWEIHSANPHWGRWKIALAVWKLGVYVSPSTVRNILNTPPPDYRRPGDALPKPKLRAINGKYPNHLWSIDLTTVYIWFRPLYILAVIDHFSRKALILTGTFHPTAEWTINRIKEAILKYGHPKHLITDKGGQFIAASFIHFLKKAGICHRYACISRANGNSKVERFFLSLKSELLNLFIFFSRRKVDKLLKDYLKYYNEYRPHEALDGRVPDDRYYHKPRDKPDKTDKTLKGEVETIVLGEGLLKAYRLKRPA